MNGLLQASPKKLSNAMPTDKPAVSPAPLHPVPFRAFQVALLSPELQR